jgi:cephalosporin hydroxylase
MSNSPYDKERVLAMGADTELQALSNRWFVESCRYNYSYNFTWMGRPLIQYPQDLVALQEIIWKLKPDLIIETGIAHGGSLIFHASMLELLGGAGRVLGIDVDIRAHNRAEIEAHPMFKRITMIEGSSIDSGVIAQVKAITEGKQCVMVLLDSNHTHEHVLSELTLYSPLVTAGSYMVVFDTVVEQMPADFFPDRPWGPGDNPATALKVFLAGSDRFEVDSEIDSKLLITAAPGGYLRCVKG